MMNRMVLANLAHRPVRSVISIIAIGLEVTLILLIVGLSLGMLNDSKDRQRGIGADVIVQPPGSTILVGMTGAPLPVKVADVLEKQPHVTVAAPVLYQFITKPQLEIIYGIDLKSYEGLRPFRYFAGGPFTGPYDVIVDDYFAKARGKKVGDQVEILNHNFTICGIVENGRGARKFLPLTTLQDLAGATGKASVFYVKVDDVKNADAVAEQIRTVPGMAEYITHSMHEYISMMTPENLPGFQPFIYTVIGVSIIIGFIVIFQAMYTAVLERTREIGVLKSMGAGKMYIVNVILRETALLAVCGIVLGVAISAAVRGIVLHKFPILRLVWDQIWVLRAAGIALTGALLGAIYPAIKAAQKDPIDALAYE